MVFRNLEIFENRDLKYLKKIIYRSDRKKRVPTLHRSSLMVGGDNPRHLNKLDELKADIIIINLEDGVAPSQKEYALYLASAFLSVQNSDSYVSVRINPLNEGGEKEIRVLNKTSLDCIRVPKIKTPKDVEKALKLVRDDIDIALSIETKEAFKNLSELAIDKRVKLFYLGILDLLNSLGLPQSLLSEENPTITYLLSRFLIEAKIAGAIPISFTFQDFKELDTFKAWCELEKEMGFLGKACISPAQVDIANEMFGIGGEVLVRAREIKELFEKSAKNGITGFVSERYGFIDEPIYKDALLILKSSC